MSKSVAGRRVLGTWGPTVLAVASAGILLMVLIGVGVSIAAPASAEEIVLTLLPLTIAIVVLGLTASARIVGGPGPFVFVIGIITYKRVPVEMIDEVHSDDGLRITLVSGEQVTSLAFGKSLLGQLVGYPRSVRAAHRIEAFIAQFPERGRHDWGEDKVTTGLRTSALTWASLCAAVATCMAVIVNLLEYS